LEAQVFLVFFLSTSEDLFILGDLEHPTENNNLFSTLFSHMSNRNLYKEGVQGHITWLLNLIT